MKYSTRRKILALIGYVVTMLTAAAGTAGTIILAQKGCYTTSEENFRREQTESMLSRDITILQERFEELQSDGFFDEAIPQQRKQALYSDFLRDYSPERTNFFFEIYDAEDQLLLSSYQDDASAFRTEQYYDQVENTSEQIMNEAEFRQFEQHHADEQPYDDYSAQQIIVPRGDPAPTLDATEPATESSSESPGQILIQSSDFSLDEQIEIALALNLGWSEHGTEEIILEQDGRSLPFTDYIRQAANASGLEISFGNGRHYVINRHQNPPDSMLLSEYAEQYPEDFALPAEYYDIYYDVKTYSYQQVLRYYITGHVRSHLQAEDAYLTAQNYSGTAYQYRWAVPGVGLISLVLWLICLIYLIRSAGYHPGEEAVREGFSEKIPYDLFTCILFGAAILLVIPADELVNYSGTAVTIGTVTAVGILWGLTALWWLMSTAIRIRAKNLFRNTLIYKIFRFLHGKLSYLANALPLVWKGILLTSGWLVLDFLAVMMIGNQNYFGVFLKILLWIAMLCFAVILLYQMYLLRTGGQQLAEGNLSEKIPEEKLFGDFRTHARHLNSIGEGMNKAVSERLKSENLRTELIANVSHDIKTPLTSIINYTDLLSKLELSDPTAREYLEVLGRQSARLRKLTEDVIEASKASTGNIKLQKEDINLTVFLQQLEGEYSEKFESRTLQYLSELPDEPVIISADGRLLWRAFDNLYGNCLKYALSGTRVYLNLLREEGTVSVTLRNISADMLNLSADALMERFVRGDRSRNTEGSGLGLSIAQSLIQLQGGTMTLTIDGDLFKVTVRFPEKIS